MKNKRRKQNLKYMSRRLAAIFLSAVLLVSDGRLAWAAQEEQEIVKDAMETEGIGISGNTVSGGDLGGQDTALGSADNLEETPDNGNSIPNWETGSWRKRKTQAGRLWKATGMCIMKATS